MNTLTHRTSPTPELSALEAEVEQRRWRKEQDGHALEMESSSRA